jgi:autotransporter-associated beta strand protein
VKTDGSVGVTNLPAINTTTYTHTLTGNGFTGSTNLVKQGDGLLVLPNVTEAYTGKTDVWAGSLAFSGTLSSSPVWMNRHTNLYGAPTISNSLTMEYGSAFCPSAAGVTDASTASYATANVNTLNMHEGSRMVIQIDPANSQSDQVNIGTLNLRTRSGDAWENYGPEYLKPVIQIAANSSLGAKKYTLGTLTTLTVNGTPVTESKTTPISSVVLEGAGEGELYFYQGELVLFLEGASWEEVTETVVVNCDFNNGETLFTPVSRISEAARRGRGSGAASTPFYRVIRHITPGYKAYNSHL